MFHNPDRIFSCEIPESNQDTRLDVFLCNSSVGLSRSRIQALIKDGHVRVNDFPSKPSHKLKPGDRVFLAIPPPVTTTLTPEEVEFQIIYEDTSLIVLSKPPGVVVHPAPGHPTKTLVHGLLKHCQDLSGIGGSMRPGIVHRLDKDTSGLMVAAKDDRTHAYLSRQFKLGSVKKEYLALVHGHLNGEKGEIALPLARHPVKRKEMAVVFSGGRDALTLWETLIEFQCGFSLLSVSIKTGRTHQIRVHLSHMGHPVAGDPVYGYRRNWWKQHFTQKNGPRIRPNRQMLHAKRLGFIHPVRKRYMEFEAPLPDDMRQVLNCLKKIDFE
jgi:23S rRNA pseudouridine1911/1915/1917 synthase